VTRVPSRVQDWLRSLILLKNRPSASGESHTYRFTVSLPEGVDDNA
jgi:hypothetical protein